MDDSKTDNHYLVFLKYLISAVLSIVLLELSGVDVTKANIFSFDTFSFSILILFSICLYTFDNMFKVIIKWFIKKNKSAINN